jgi:hypothetical protein
MPVDRAPANEHGNHPTYFESSASTTKTWKKAIENLRTLRTKGREALREAQPDGPSGRP